MKLFKGKSKNCEKILKGLKYIEMWNMQHFENFAVNLIANWLKCSCRVRLGNNLLNYLNYLKYFENSF